MSTANSISMHPRHRGSVLRLSLVIAGVIAALALTDVFLEKTEQSELAALALQADRNGQKLLAAGHASEAVDAFRKAHALVRENAKYELDLIRALMAAGKLAEAQPLMSEILDEKSNDGQANLVAARLAAKQGHINSANSYYHRAIYGEWPSDLKQHQIEARLELIHFLQAHDQQNEVLAELLPLEEQVGSNPNFQPVVAKLFLAAGSPSRAINIYRDLVKANPKDPTYYMGLGEAELANGDFRAAHTAFSNAIERGGAQDPTARNRLQLAATLRSLDPTIRWLPDTERYLRARKILQMTATDAAQCISNHPNSDANELLTTAEAQLASSVPKQATNEMAEGTLSLAERLWNLRQNACSHGTDSDETIAFLMEKVAR